MKKVVVISIIIGTALFIFCKKSPQTTKVQPPNETAVSLLDTTHILAYGYPAYSDTVLDQTYFIIAYNRNLKIPEWVAYYLTKESLTGTTPRSDDFRPDPELPADKQASLADYERSGYDRGHMAPAAAFKQNRKAMSTTFLLTNMTPQTPQINRYGWKDLEEDERKLLDEYQEIWVITGCTLLDSTMKRISPQEYIGNLVYIPTHFYKAILAKRINGIFDAFAFIIPNQKTLLAHPVYYYSITADSLETLTGLDFFNILDDTIETAIEAKKPLLRYMEDRN